MFTPAPGPFRGGPAQKCDNLDYVKELINLSKIVVSTFLWLASYHLNNHLCQQQLNDLFLLIIINRIPVPLHPLASANLYILDCLFDKFRGMATASDLKILAGTRIRWNAGPDSIFCHYVFASYVKTNKSYATTIDLFLKG